MDIRFPFQEKDMFRMVNATLLACIVMVTLGSLFGITTVKARHFVFVLLIVCAISFLQYLFLKRRLISVLGLSAFLCMAAVVVGIEQTVLFFESYINWLGDKGQWQPEWVTGYEIKIGRAHV